ncbi:HlyD family secretion protein [Tropicimonas sp. IMCC6043]|uniref:HlyD family secretion protein n=1 Tax=Tropicimonas sp. IMCC6043 TaxID=2510645 RepID=UPI00101BA790|nr:biotin/lipoyl-binding protein [Tropicimonas sp. IMCC6043]RYH09811.1 HlyD family secretion protein [Tropicimonas sp. IMCC6043]
MLELLFCSLLTVYPDYLYRHYAQGKRLGHEITFFTVWYELRIGITACLMLTVTLITIVFYYHPSTTDVTSFFRTVTILSEGPGRVKEVFVANNSSVEAGAPIFSLEDSAQQAAVETARKRIAEVEAEFVTAESELAAARGTVDQAEGAYTQALEEYELRKKLLDEGSAATSPREVERLGNTVDSRSGALETARAQLKAVETKIGTALPARQETAEAQLAEAEAALAKTVVYARVDGIVQQFALQPGDIVNPVLRPAGVLVPPQISHGYFQAGFNQLSGQVIHPGMIAEMTCLSQPFVIVPMQVAAVMPFIAAGQFRPSDTLLDVQDRARPGTITVLLQEIFEGSTDRIPPGSKCIVNVYTDNHARLESGEVGFWQGIYLHIVDTVGLVHALILRIQALLLPVNTLVLSGH